MKTKAANPGTSLTVPGDGFSADIVRVALEVVQLKHLFRQGWLQRGVPEARCETVAEHVFSVALLAMFLADHVRLDLDVARVMRIALIHDLGEIGAGDITPADGVSLEEKRRRERTSLANLLSRLPEGGRYLELWEEFEARSTPEARFVREVDRLEMAVQAAVYRGQLGSDISDFLATARRDVTDGALGEVLERISRIVWQG